MLLCPNTNRQTLQVKTPVAGPARAGVLRFFAAAEDYDEATGYLRDRVSGGVGTLFGNPPTVLRFPDQPARLLMTGTSMFRFDTLQSILYSDDSGLLVAARYRIPDTVPFAAIGTIVSKNTHTPTYYGWAYGYEKGWYEHSHSAGLRMSADLYAMVGSVGVSTTDTRTTASAVQRTPPTGFAFCGSTSGPEWYTSNYYASYDIDTKGAGAPLVVGAAAGVSGGYAEYFNGELEWVAVWEVPYINERTIQVFVDTSLVPSTPRAVWALPPVVPLARYVDPGWYANEGLLVPSLPANANARTVGALYRTSNSVVRVALRNGNTTYNVALTGDSPNTPANYELVVRPGNIVYVSKDAYAFTTYVKLYTEWYEAYPNSRGNLYAGRLGTITVLPYPEGSVANTGELRLVGGAFYVDPGTPYSQVSVTGTLYAPPPARSIAQLSVANGQATIHGFTLGPNGPTVAGTRVAPLTIASAVATINSTNVFAPSTPSVYFTRYIGSGIKQNSNTNYTATSTLIAGHSYDLRVTGCNLHSRSEGRLLAALFPIYSYTSADQYAPWYTNGATGVVEWQYDSAKTDTVVTSGNASVAVSGRSHAPNTTYSQQAIPADSISSRAGTLLTFKTGWGSLDYGILGGTTYVYDYTTYRTASAAYMRGSPLSIFISLAYEYAWSTATSGNLPDRSTPRYEDFEIDFKIVFKWHNANTRHVYAKMFYAATASTGSALGNTYHPAIDTFATGVALVPRSGGYEIHKLRNNSGATVVSVGSTGWVTPVGSSLVYYEVTYDLGVCYPGPIELGVFALSLIDGYMDPVLEVTYA